MKQLFTMAFRDIGRNRRRSFFSSLALAMGLAMLLLVAAVIEGEYSSAMDSTIRLQSGHIQVRANAYNEAKTSLKWEDLIEDPAQLVANITALPAVQVATPRLFASGIISIRDKSAGVRIIGIDPLSEANLPYQQGIRSGTFLSADDREGILIGVPLAKKLALQVGDQFNLSVNTSNGDVDEQSFTIRGIYSTETNGFDSTTVFLPLTKAQAITRAGNHASTIFVLLKDKTQTDAVAAQLQDPAYQVLPWTSMNDLLLETEEMAKGYIVVLYMIVLAITATVITNTLIMSVFERTREIGILSALGMKSRRIMALFLAESSILAVGGILMGLALGLLAVAYFAKVGFDISNMGVTGILMGNTIYASLTLKDTLNLTIISFVITLIAGLYPAVLAARMEPVDALRGK